MFQPIPTRLYSLALAISLSVPVSAFASTVDANLEAGGVWNAPPTISSTPATSASFSSSALFSADNGSSNASSAMAAFDGNGHFGNSASAVHDLNSYPDLAYSKSTLTFLNSVTNTTGAAQTAKFDININSLYFTYHTGWKGENTATFSARVFVNGALAPIWESTATLLGRTDAARSYYYEDLITGGTTQLEFLRGASEYLDNQRGWAIDYRLDPAFSTVLNLGNVAAGESLNIRYEVDLYAATSSYGGFASVEFDDPSALTHDLSSNLPRSAGLYLVPNVPAVPEPNSAAMLAAGLALLGSVARRRKGRR